MGMLNWGGAFSAAGGAVAAVGFEGVKASLEQDKIRLADQLAGTREERGDVRREGYKVAGEGRAEATAVRAEGRGLVNRAVERQTILGETLDNAPALRQIQVDDFKAKAQAELAFKTDPTNVRAQAEAKALGDKIIATSAADNARELITRPDYLQNLEKISLAEHPEKKAQIAASLSTAALNNFKLGQEKLVQGARLELRDAATPEAKSAAKTKIEALEWSVQGDRARATADASVISSLEKVAKDQDAAAANPMSSDAQKAAATDGAARTRATIDALRVEYEKQRGITPTVTPAPPDGTEVRGKDGKTYVVQGGVPVLKGSVQPGAKPGARSAIPTQTDDRSEMDKLPAGILSGAQNKERVNRLKAVLDNPAIQLPASERERLARELSSLTN